MPARPRHPFSDPKHAARVTLGVVHAKRNIALARRRKGLLLRLKCNFHVSAHHVFGHAGHAGNECADVAASLGMRGLISENNVPLFFGLREVFLCKAFLRSLTVLTRIAEVLHSITVQSQPGLKKMTSVRVGHSDSENGASLADAENDAFFIDTRTWKETRQKVPSRSKHGRRKRRLPGMCSDEMTSEDIEPPTGTDLDTSSLWLSRTRRSDWSATNPRIALFSQLFGSGC